MHKLFSLFMMLFCLIFPWSVHAEAAPSPSGSAQLVIQQFATDDVESAERKIEMQRKHEILFLMGCTLLILLLLTAGFGIAMVVFGKDVFVGHMIFAGFSLTLSLVHAATAIVWFWPY
ncbi:MAG: hypothetical protein HQM07_09705 [Zetaproteobacteria bacterium]|nr:hypothetical protein [Zetaproteobacteria bacterium]